MPAHDLGRQAHHGCEAPIERLGRRRRQGVAAGEARQQLRQAESLGLGEDVLQIPRSCGGERAFAVPVRHRGERGHPQHPGQERVVVAVVQAELQDRRDQHGAIDLDPLALGEQIGERRDPKAAVALADQKLRRGPALVPAEPEADERGQRIQIRLRAEEAACRLLASAVTVAAEAGLDRIDEHEVGEREPGIRVRHDPGGRRGRRAVLERDPPGPQRAEMEIGGRRARPAIEHEGDRARSRLGQVRRIGDVEQMCIRPLGILAERQSAGGGGITDAAAADLDLVPGGRRLGQRGRRRPRRRSGRAWRAGGRLRRIGLRGVRRGRDRQASPQAARQGPGACASSSRSPAQRWLLSGSSRSWRARVAGRPVPVSMPSTVSTKHPATVTATASA